MEKKSSPRKSRQTNCPLTPSEVMVRCFSIPPDPVVKEAKESASKSIIDFFAGIGKGWQTQQAAFAQYGIDYTDIALRVMDTGVCFMTLRDFGKGVETYVKTVQKRIAPYIRAASLLTKLEAPFSSSLKEAIQEEAELLAMISQMKAFSRQDLERTLQIPEGTKRLDPDTQKSLHKQPMFVMLGDELFSDLQKKKVTKYRAARLLHNLWLSAGIIRTSKDCDLESFERHLLRRQQKPSGTSAVVR